MTKQQFDKLMDKHLNGSASPEEEQELFEWYDTFQQKSAEKEPLSSRESDELLDKIKSRINAAVIRRRTYLMWSGIAASLIFMLLSTWLIWKTNAPLKNEFVQVITHKNQKQHIRLPDGTSVWLNTASKMKYPAFFSNSRREIWLTGEGYFEVQHDPKRPFIVHTDDIDVRVLGTIFNLKAYPHAITEASLLRGSVEVKVNDRSEQKIILKPYQKLIAADDRSRTAGSVNTITHKITVEPIVHKGQSAFIAETAWTQKAFSFSNETFNVITGKLEKVYGIKIIIQNPKYKDIRFTGTFDNVSISTVINALQFSNEFKYRKEGEGTIIIY
jgi:transmembrane sensor